MKLDRRKLLAGSSAAAFATMAKGAIVSVPDGPSPIVPSGWNTLPLGCGGLVTGFNIGPDGTMVCRTDVGNCYRWSGTTAKVADPSQRWVPLLNYASMGGGAVFSSNLGGYELVIAPNNTNILYGIFADNAGSATAYYLYRSTNAGGRWAKTNLSMRNAGSNSTWKNASGKVAVDPNNSDIVYCGMPKSSGNSYSAYRALDGVTFTPIRSIMATTQDPGCCGVVFDAKYGTVTVAGQLRTARVIVPVGGVGIFESLDGGETWTETAVAPMGRPTIAVFQGYLDFDGVYYCQVNYGSGQGYIWRYSGPAGKFVQLDAQVGWPVGAGWLNANGGILIVDPRDGHQGYVSATGPNGIGAGFTSLNANSANPSNITWSGRTGGETPVVNAPNYDVLWLNHATQGLNAFLQGTAAFIDSNGVCWWSGAQGFWFFNSIPNYGASTTTTSTAVARGTEVTVAQDVCCPPGAQFPIMASQDVGIMRGTFTTFPTNYYVSRGRMDCECIDWAASDPSFMVSRVNIEIASTVAAGALSAYSTNYGETGSWTPYATQADLMYQGSVTGNVSDGVGGSGTILNVTAVASGNVMPGQAVFSGSTQLGTITAYRTGTGGIGTYTVDTARLTSSGSLGLVLATQCGAVVAVDHDHHVCVPSGYNGAFVPVYTTNATSPSCSWNFCSGLPQFKWTNRSFVYGATARPIAVDRVNIGTVYAVAASLVSDWTIYRSTDSGATWATVSTLAGGRGAFTSVYLNSVPGYAGHLWLTAQYTGGVHGLWRSTNGGNTWSSVKYPNGLIYAFCLGAAYAPGAYPTLYALTYATYGAPKKLYYSIDQGVSWSLFGATGTQQDLPKSCQLAGIQSINGDWNVFKRLYVCSGQSGFAYYNP